MAYSATINREFKYIKVYKIKKSVKGNGNAFSRLVYSLMQRYVMKNSAGGGMGQVEAERE